MKKENVDIGFISENNMFYMKPLYKNFIINGSKFMAYLIMHGIYNLYGSFECSLKPCKIMLKILEMFYSVFRFILNHKSDWLVFGAPNAYIYKFIKQDFIWRRVVVVLRVNCWYILLPDNSVVSTLPTTITASNL